MNQKTKILVGILVIGLILIMISSIQPLNNTDQTELKISVNGNFELISNIQLPLDKNEAKRIVKGFCEPKNSDAVYGYDTIKEVDNEWRVQIVNMNGMCYATMDVKSGETNCEKCDDVNLFPPFEEVTITTDKTEYEQGETVEINLRNDRDSTIYLDLESYTYNYKIYLEEYEPGFWKASNYNFAQRIKCAPGGQGPAIGCLKIEGKNTNKRPIRLSYQICAGGEEPYWETGKFPEAKYIDLPKGEYRLKISIKEECDKEEESIYSNEFTIKEKSTLDLRCSEKVKFSGNCEMATAGIEFNSNTRKCVIKYGSCSVESPFKSLEECQDVCEKKSSCNWCGRHCVEYPISKYDCKVANGILDKQCACSQVIPPKNFICGRENGKCVAKQITTFNP